MGVIFIHVSNPTRLFMQWRVTHMSKTFAESGPGSNNCILITDNPQAMCTKEFFSWTITKVISLFFFPPFLLFDLKGGTNNPNQIKLTFEPFLLYFFSCHDFFSLLVIWRLVLGYSHFPRQDCLSSPDKSLLSPFCPAPLWSHLPVRQKRTPVQSECIANKLATISFLCTIFSRDQDRDREFLTLFSTGWTVRECSVMADW